MGKLVRDRIPDIIRISGSEPDVTVVEGDALLDALKDKLVEEAGEVREAEPGAVIEELADVLEVIDALIERLGIDRDDLEACRSAKNRERGGFRNGYWLA